MTNGPNNQILDSLRRIRLAGILAKIYDGGFSSLAVLVVSALASTILELIFQFGTVGREILFSVSSFVFLLTVFKYVVPHAIRYLSSARTDELLEAALRVGKGYPDLKDRLRNAVELMSPGQGQFSSEELSQAYIGQIFTKASTLDVGPALKYKSKSGPRIFLASSIAATLITVILFPSQVPSAFGRVVNFTHRYAAPKAYMIAVTPGDTELSRGDTLNVEVDLSLATATRLPSHITISEKYAGEKEFEKHQAKQSGDAKYYFQFPNVRSSLVYFITAGEQSTPEYNVKVVDLPIVQSFTVTLVYPSYTGKAPEILQDNIGDFTALAGTRAEYSLRANKDLRSAWIAFDDSTKARLTPSASNAAGAFIIKRTAKYAIRLIDTDSLENRAPIIYSIEAVSDEYPTCEITSPGRDVDLSRDMQLPLRISIGDDYGFTKLLLQYKLISSKYAPAEKDYHSIEIPLRSKSAGQEDIDYFWDLTSLGLVPEDVISYHARVYDNDMVNGPKSTVSPEYTLRLPSLQEAFESADRENSDLVRKTEDALSSSDNLKNQLDKISEEMKTATKQMSWEQEKKMQNTLQKYDSLQKKIEAVKKEIESMTRKMLENRLVSPQTLEKYLELQKALQEINSPEFQEALKKLQQAIQSLNPDLVRQAMQNFQMNEDMLRKSIERTLSLIKRVQIEQKLDEMQKRADQMIAHQDSLRNSTAESDSTDNNARARLSESEKGIRKELSQTERAMSDLKTRMNEFAKEMPTKELQEAKQTLDSSRVGNKMDEAGDELSKGNFSGSMKVQSQISSALNDFKRQLAETQRSMLQNQQQATINALRKTQQNLLEISKEQESLRDQSGRTMPNSAESRSLADKQNELMQQLGYSAQQMMQLSNKSFAVTPQMGRQIGEAYSQMQKSLNTLQSRSGESPTQSQGQAMGAMNQAVLSIQATLQSMMQGQGGGGGGMSLMQQLEQLAGNQQGLNALTGQLGEHGALSMEQQAEIARLAVQQEAIRKSLEQLAREAAGSQQQDRVLGNLDQIAKEMKPVVSDLQNKSITQETIRRQERILSHLLDASRSIRQRDYDNRRVTKAGTDVITQSPGQLQLSNPEAEQQLLKLIRQNFPPEYQEVILRYYRLLQKTPE